MPLAGRHHVSVKIPAYLSTIPLLTESDTYRRRGIRETFDPFSLERRYTRRREVLQLGQSSK